MTASRKGTPNCRNCQHVKPETGPIVKKIGLLAIARAANLNNRECSPSVQSLAFKCGVSESTVRCAIAEFEELGLIETLKVPGKGRVYRVMLGVEATA